MHAKREANEVGTGRHKIGEQRLARCATVGASSALLGHVRPREAPTGSGSGSVVTDARTSPRVSVDLLSELVLMSSCCEVGRCVNRAVRWTLVPVLQDTLPTM